MMFQVISSVIAVYFSSIVFEVPKRLIKYTALIGGIGWWIYLLFLDSAGMELSTYYSSFPHSSQIFQSSSNRVLYPRIFPTSSRSWNVSNSLCIFNG